MNVRKMVQFFALGLLKFYSPPLSKMLHHKQGPVQTRGWGRGGTSARYVVEYLHVS